MPKIALANSDVVSKVTDESEIVNVFVEVKGILKRHDSIRRRLLRVRALLTLCSDKIGLKRQPWRNSMNSILSQNQIRSIGMVTVKNISKIVANIPVGENDLYEGGVLKEELQEALAEVEAYFANT